MTPVFIHTASDFAATVSLGVTTESLHLEFKRDLDGWKAPDAAVRRDRQKELARDIAQFCNSTGGCVLIGVEEKQRHEARVAARIFPLDDFDGRRQWVEQAVHNFLVPAAFRLEIARIVVGGGTIMALNIPPNERLVSVWDRQTGSTECFRRSNHGRQALHPTEVEAHLGDSRRAAQLALERVRTELPGVAQVELASGVWHARRHRTGDPLLTERVTDANVLLSTVGEHEFELCVRSGVNARTSVGGEMIRIPYGLVREVWATADRKVGLFLHVRVLHQHGGLTLDPF
jgi:hypothetical protein